MSKESDIGVYPNLSRYAASRAQTAQSEPNGAFSSQQLRGEPERSHPFAKPLWGPKNSNEGSTLAPFPRFTELLDSNHAVKQS